MAEMEKHMPRLESLCLVTSASPIPRPLIPHKPYLQKGHPWGNGSMPGQYISGGGSSGRRINGTSGKATRAPAAANGVDGSIAAAADASVSKNSQGFAPRMLQPGRLDYEFGLKWLALYETHDKVKRDLWRKHAEELAPGMLKIALEMEDHEVEYNEEAFGEVPPPSLGQASSSSWLWLKDIPGDITAEDLMTAFDRFGYPKQAILLKDPVTGAGNGHDLVRMESVERAVAVADSLSRTMFVLRDGAPRPVRVQVARVGPPGGSQSIFDRATRAVFNQHATAPLNDDVKLIEIPDSMYAKDHGTEIQRAAIETRCLLRNQLRERVEAGKMAQRAVVELAKRQQVVLEREVSKLRVLKGLISQPVMQQIVGN